MVGVIRSSVAIVFPGVQRTGHDERLGLLALVAPMPKPSFVTAASILSRGVVPGSSFSVSFSAMTATLTSLTPEAAPQPSGSSRHRMRNPSR